MTRKLGAKGAKKKADDLFAKIVRERGECVRCHRRENLQCAHIVPRRFTATRCEFDNAWCMCARCHLALTDDPFAHVSFAVAQLGEDGYAALRKRARDGIASKVDWVARAAELSELWKVLAR